MAMQLGAEPKKIAILAFLAVVLVAVFWINSQPDYPQQQTQTAPAKKGSKRSVSGEVAVPDGSPGLAEPPSASAEPAPAAPPTGGRPAPPRGVAGPQRGAQRGQRQLQEFRPVVGSRRPEDRIDPLTYDPSLRLDVLAKLQTVSVGGSRRSLFEFGQAAPPPPPPTTAKRPPVPSPLVKPVAVTNPAVTPAVSSGPPPKPQAPPIPLKFYGYLSPTANPGGKRAFFLEGEEIHVASEGEIIKKRYRVIRIGLNSVVLEDIEFQSQQTLPLEEQQQG